MTTLPGVSGPLRAKNVPPRPRLGEELPLFCEKCGYCLHGLPQIRCGHCELLQFHCPECGHHQPINTLRPAALRVFQRLRALALAVLVLFKLNYFGWLAVAWIGMGMEWYWTYSPLFLPDLPNVSPTNHIERLIELTVCFGALALPFGAVGRMLLLRWGSGWRVGAILGVIAAACIYAGAALHHAGYYSPNEPVHTPGLVFIMLWTFAMVFLSGVLAWPVWLALVHLFLPARAAGPLLEWQRSLSQPPTVPTRW